MSNPAVAATQDDNDEEVIDNKATIEQKVNDLTDKVTRDEKTGKYVLPEGLSDLEQVAVIAERRRRDTQSGFTKVAQTNKQLTAEKAALLKEVQGSAKVELTKEQTEELEELKFSDPEAWRKKVNKYEADATAKHNLDVQERLKQVSKVTLDTEELERREQVLKDYNTANPDFTLDDDIIANDIPPRIVKRLETGQVTFEEFLQECHDYSKTGKVIKQDKIHQQPNLSKVGGGARPDANAVTEDIVLSYDKEVF